MTAAAGLYNHTALSGQTLAGVRITPMASSNSDVNSAGEKSSASAITANDFLTLLVTEMKNQDPTANTDPNEYINQLVNVNSLQQLISINETLTSAFAKAMPFSQPEAELNSATSAGDSAKVVSEAKGASEATRQYGSAAVSDANGSAIDGSTLQAIIGKLAHGNLSAPAANPAAERLAHALDGHNRSNLSK